MLSELHCIFNKILALAEKEPVVDSCRFKKSDDFRINSPIPRLSSDKWLWGWSLSDGEFYPKTTDLPPAPSDLLKIIHCNCTTDCSTARCTCQKHGMKCSLACGNCHGSSCMNAIEMIADDDEDQSHPEEIIS